MKGGVHYGPNDRVKRKKMLIVIYFSMVLMDFFHLYLEILNVNIDLVYVLIDFNSYFCGFLVNFSNSVSF